MSISNVQSNIEGASGATPSTTVAKAYTSAVGAGNLLVALVGNGGGATAPTGVSDSVNGSWTKAKDESGNGLYASIWYFKGTAAGTPTVTATWAANQTFIEIVLFEDSTTTSWNSTLVDTSSVNTSAAATTFDPGSLTTTNANDILFAYAVVGNTCTGGQTGWTFFETTTNSDGAQYIIKSATGTYATAMTGTSGAYAAVAVALGASSGSTVTLPSTTMQAALGIANSPVLKGRIAGGATVTMQAAFGIANSPVLKGKLAGGATVNMQAAFGIAGQISKLQIASVSLQALFGIKPPPTLVVPGGNKPVFYFTDSFGVHRVAPD